MTTEERVDPPGEPGAGGAAGPAGEDPRVRAGLEHLQRAAHEAIAASRAFLDVAEELVDDPAALRAMFDVVGGLGDQVARRAARATRLAGRSATRAGGADEWNGGWDDEADDADDDDPPVQRIPIS